jgi:hypothetical protein
MGVPVSNRLYVAFDARGVDVAAFGRRQGRTRVQAFSHTALEPGTLVPSPSGTNLVRGDEVRDALARALDELGPPGARAMLVLPDGIARLALVDVPPGADARDYVRFRLAASLPWPAAEALVEALPVGRRRVVGAAVRRATVAQYEQLAAAAGLSPERVHLAPLMALSALARGAVADGVHAVLGDVALCLAFIRDGGIVSVRNRRRDGVGEEARWLLDEVRRTAGQAGDGRGRVELILSGSGAEDLRRTLGQAATGRSLQGPREWPAATEAAWLAGVLT